MKRRLGWITTAMAEEMEVEAYVKGFLAGVGLVCFIVFVVLFVRWELLS